MEQILIDRRLIPCAEPGDSYAKKCGSPELNTNSANQHLIKALIIAGFHPSSRSTNEDLKGPSPGLVQRWGKILWMLMFCSSGDAEFQPQLCTGYSGDKDKDKQHFGPAPKDKVPSDLRNAPSYSTQHGLPDSSQEDSFLGSHSLGNRLPRLRWVDPGLQDGRLERIQARRRSGGR